MRYRKLALSEQFVAHLEEVVASVTVDRQTLEQSATHALASLAWVRVHRNDFGDLVGLLFDFTAFRGSRLTHNRRGGGHVEAIWNRSWHMAFIAWTTEAIDFRFDTARYWRRTSLLETNDFTTWKEKRVLFNGMLHLVGFQEVSLIEFSNF